MANPKNILVILFNLGECIWKERFHPYISRGSWDILGWYHSVAKLWFRVHTANAALRHFWSAALFGAVYSSMQQGRGACLGQLGGRAGRSAWAIWRHRQDAEARCPKGHPTDFKKASHLNGAHGAWDNVGFARVKKHELRGDGSCPEALLIGQLQWWESRRSLKWMPWVCPDPTIPSQRVFFLFEKVWNSFD